MWKLLTDYFENYVLEGFRNEMQKQNAKTK